jgi:hypothetical protein
MCDTTFYAGELKNILNIVIAVSMSEVHQVRVVRRVRALMPLISNHKIQNTDLMDGHISRNWLAQRFKKVWRSAKPRADVRNRISQNSVVI